MGAIFSKFSVLLSIVIKLSALAVYKFTSGLTKLALSMLPTFLKTAIGHRFQSGATDTRKADLVIARENNVISVF